MFLLFWSCAAPVEVAAPRCTVTVESITPEQAAPKGEITLVGSPFTERWDTAVTFGAVQGVVTGVTRTDCTQCDACREDSGCSACDDCDACDAVCEAECIESTTVVIPELDPGTYPLQLFNQHGQSNTVDFVIEDKGAKDTGGTDTGDTADTGDSSTK